MKNLFLPFVVVAVFAIGSCGDDVVQPLVNKPNDTTANKDTIVQIKLKEVKGLYVNIPAIMVNTSGTYIGTGAGGSYNTKIDTVKGYCGRNFNPYFNGKPGNVYASRYDSKNNSYIFTWNTYTAGPIFLDSLSFTVDTVKRELYNITYKSNGNINMGSGSSSSDEFFVQIKNARYKVENNNLIILFSQGLEDSIEKFSGSSGSSYWRSSYYYKHSIGLDPSQTASFNLQISLE